VADEGVEGAEAEDEEGTEELEVGLALNLVGEWVVAKVVRIDRQKWNDSWCILPPYFLHPTLSP